MAARRKASKGKAKRPATAKRKAPNRRSLPPEVVASDDNFRRAGIAEAEAFAAELAEFARACRGERPDGFEGLPQYLWALRDSRRRYREIARETEAENARRRAAGFPRNPPHYDHREVFAMLARGVRRESRPTSAHEQAAIETYRDAWLVFVELCDAINTNSDASRRRLKRMLHAVDASLREEPERRSPETPKGTERQHAASELLDPDLWKPTTKRPKAPIKPSIEEQLAAASRLHGELHNYLQAGGRGECALDHLRDLLDDYYRKDVVEPDESAQLSRWLVLEAWDAVALGAQATPALQGVALRKQLKEIVENARDLRGFPYAQLVPSKQVDPGVAPGAMAKTSAPEPSPFDVDDATAQLYRILRPKKQSGPKLSPESMAVEIYAVLARGSVSGVPHNRKKSRSRALKLVRALRPPTKP